MPRKTIIWAKTPRGGEKNKLKKSAASFYEVILEVLQQKWHDSEFMMMSLPEEVLSWVLSPAETRRESAKTTMGLSGISVVLFIVLHTSYSSPLPSQQVQEGELTSAMVSMPHYTYSIV